MKKATRQQTKTHNTHLILKTIYNQGQISRANIARLTNLTPTTVSDMVGELIADGLVQEIGQGPSAGGKPPILLSIVDDSNHLIGIDLASNEFRGAVINLRGTIKHRLHLSIGDLGGQEALNRVYDLIDGLLKITNTPTLGIGIGTPGLMDAGRGVVINSVNMGWQHLPLRDLLQKRYALPVYIANDCQVAALGEFTFGDNKGQPSLVLIKIARGVGAGIILNQQLYHGDGGYGAGEIGHVMVEENGELCMCGHYGCLETIVSGRALVRQVKAAKVKQRASIDPHAPSENMDEITFAALKQALLAGDPTVCAVIERAGAFLGHTITHLVCALGIRHVVLSGHVVELGARLIEPVQRQIRRGALAALADETELSISTLGPDVVILGAAALVLSEELGL
ncbi:MAG: ROK family transcriptional regulator [Anaerolineae bacterium]|nr:ROK family transcriptional regulator [Anaerolineae bacterium]